MVQLLPDPGTPYNKMFEPPSMRSTLSKSLSRSSSKISSSNKDFVEPKNQDNFQLQKYLGFLQK